MIVLPAIVAELVPAIAGAVVAGAGWVFYKIESSKQKARHAMEAERTVADMKAKVVSKAVFRGATNLQTHGKVVVTSDNIIADRTLSPKPYYSFREEA